MGGYRGGAFDTWIPDSYTAEDYEADMKVVAPLVLCMSAKPEYKDFADQVANLLILNKQIESAFGRVTAYAERNNFDEIYSDWMEE